MGLVMALFRILTQADHCSLTTFSQTSCPKLAHIDANETPPIVPVYGHFGGVFILLGVNGEMSY